MKKTVVSIIFAAIILSGCGDKFRIYSLATMDRVSGRDSGMLDVEEDLRLYGIQLIDEDSVEVSVDPGFLNVQRMRLCAAMWSDRLDGAVALGEKLEVDAVVFSTMPPIYSKLREDLPCMVDSLITLYLVDPPTVIVEAHDYGEFLYRLGEFDWETIVAPPPLPVEFEIALGDSVEFADLIITIVESDTVDEEVLSKEDANLDESNKESDSIKKSKDMFSESDNFSGDGGEGRIAVKQKNYPWAVVIYRGSYLEKREAFESRVVNKVSGRLKYDISEIGGAPLQFKLVLTDIRIE
jgi:hypothetical protein